MMTIKKRIQTDIENNPVILYIKGTAQMPQCGFSATVVQILTKVGVDFHTVNVLEDPEIRQGIKEYSNWPTIPQLYIKEKFIGGCDIIKEMYQTGELKSLLQEQGLIPNA